MRYNVVFMMIKQLKSEFGMCEVFSVLIGRRPIYVATFNDDVPETLCIYVFAG